ncbi:MAG: AI-2E family transporter [Agathobacter sp.]
MTEKDNQQEKGTLQEKSKNKKNDEKKYLKMGITGFCTIAAAILFFFALYRMDEISGMFAIIFKSAEPIIIGLVLAYLLMPVKNFVERPIFRLMLKTGLKEKTCKDFSRGIGIAGALIFFFILIGIFVSILVPALGSSIVTLVNNMSKYVTSFIAWTEEIGIKDTTIFVMLGEYLTEFTASLEVWAKNDLLPLVQQYIAQITTGVFAVFKTFLNFIIGIVVVVYVMSIEETLRGQGKKAIYAFFPAQKGNLIIATLRKSNEIFGGFIMGKILDSAIIGVICYIGCLILRIPSALLVAVIIGVTNVIPFFGPFIGAIPSVLIVLIQSPIHGIYLAIFILILQQVDGNIIGPKILGDTTGLSSFWVLFAILVAGGLFGFVGMLLGVPVFAVIYYIIQEVIKYRMEKRKLSSNTEDYIKLLYIDSQTKEMVYDEEIPEETAEEENVE